MCTYLFDRFHEKIHKFIDIYTIHVHSMVVHALQGEIRHMYLQFTYHKHEWSAPAEISASHWLIQRR